MNDGSYPLRAPCPCGSAEGYITEAGYQDVVRCRRCDRYQYNAPRLETGKATRTVSSRPGLTPAQRWRILERYGHACVGCGRRPPEVELHIDHLIPRAVADEFGFLDAVIDSDVNLGPLCPECNLGKGTRPVSIQLLYRLLLIRRERTSP